MELAVSGTVMKYGTQNDYIQSSTWKTATAAAVLEPLEIYNLAVFSRG